jgi:hypothetical protein
MPYQVIGAGMILGGSGMLNAVLGYLPGSSIAEPENLLVLEDIERFYTFPTDWNSSILAWQ